MKWLADTLSTLIGKITPVQSFVTVLVIITLTAGYFIYKEYNDTMIELATVQRGNPSSEKNYNVEKYMKDPFETKPAEKKK